MPPRRISHPDRSARRASRPRRAHPWRRVTLCVLVAAVAGAVLLSAWKSGDGTPAAAARVRASAGAPTADPQASDSSHARTQRATARSRLGSGHSVTLAFAGDVHFESPIREKLTASPPALLAPMAPILSRADLAVVNLETAVTERGVPATKEFVFRAPASAFAALREGGVDVVTVANNHGMDYGTVGLHDTLAAARHSGVPVIGAGVNETKAYKPYRTTLNGQRIAVIGATQVLDDDLISAWTAGPGKPGLASAKNVQRLVRAVLEARATSDTVVVFLHWGVELATCPTEAQRSLADALVAAGADVIVGSHAHVLLGAGRKDGAFVDYGLGNFVFYADNELTTRSGVLEVTVTGRHVDRYRWVPARISGGIPTPLAGSARGAAVRSWRALRTCTDLRP